MRKVFIIILLFIIGAVWCNILPVVENFEFSQRRDGSKIVDVFYDVMDADGDTLSVNMLVSDDGGVTWEVNCDSLSGDVGDGILSGTGKQIIWNFGAEHPGTFGIDYVVRLQVDDGYIEQIEGMAFVEGGSFDMGDHFNEGGAEELPVHEVTLNSFYFGQYEVTQGEYAAVMGSNPSYFINIGENAPVEQVTWYNTVEYCNALSIQEELTPCYDLSDWSCDFSANGYRLPTEAEWEYASRGGLNWTDNYRYSGTTDNLGDYAWYTSNSGGHTHEVGTKAPNQLDIYDMSGNVDEWCNDWYLVSYYGSSPASNPTGPDNSGSGRVFRDSNWWRGDAIRCRVARRGDGLPVSSGASLGFRILRAYE